MHNSSTTYLRMGSVLNLLGFKKSSSLAKSRI
jgi:hypothetical protein